MRFLLRFFFKFLLPLAIIVLPAAIVIFGIEKTAAVANGSKLAYADVRRGQDFLKRYDPRRMPVGKITVVRASEPEIQSGIASAVSTLPNVRSMASVDTAGVHLVVTGVLPVPDNPLGRYVNLRLDIPPSQNRFELSKLSIGKIEIPGAMAVRIFEIALDYFAGDGTGDAVMESVRSVQVAGNSVVVAYRPPEGVIDNLSAAARKAIGGADPEIVRVYFAKINELYSRGGGGRSSLADYVGPVFALAKTRSQSGDPVAENRGAIMAIAMYFGSLSFERMIGTVRTDEMRGWSREGENVRLEGRHDFVQHFTISAGLTLTGGKGVADMIGAAKEIKDSNKGSGFSFTDIAADMAGVLFAETATASEASARRFQDALANSSDERIFFPRARDLPEGLTEAQFKGRYGDVDSPQYRQVIAEIERRLGAIALYR